MGGARDFKAGFYGGLVGRSVLVSWVWAFYLAGSLRGGCLYLARDYARSESRVDY